MIKANVVKHRLIFKNPAGTSRGVLTQKDVFYLLLSDSSNPEKKGIGEIAPLPKLSPDAIPELEKIITDLINKINSGTKINPENYSQYPAIRFGFETALAGIRMGSPVLLNPSDFTKGEKGIPINGLIWMGGLDFMKQQVEEKIDAGFRCLKFKIGAIGLEKEMKLLREIRKRFSADKLEVRVDANGAFSPKEAPIILKELAALNLHSIEQPIKAGQVEMMKQLCATSPLPVALDEELIGITQKEEKERLLDRIKPAYIILKPTLTGGIEASEEWIALAEERGIGWWVTSALESNIGLNAISQWTATIRPKGFQGLGTGGLFENNIPSPLKVSKGEIFYNPEKQWDFKKLL